MVFILFFPASVIKKVIRLNMQFIRTRMPYLFIKKLHGAISRTMCISILDNGMLILEILLGLMP